MPQEIGYARVSKTEQHLALQVDALKKRGVVRVFTDKQTGIRFDRKAFLAAIAYLNEGDTLVVWKLDRLGRSLQKLIETLEKLKKRNIHLLPLTEDVYTSTPTGMLFFQFLPPGSDGILIMLLLLRKSAVLPYVSSSTRAFSHALRNAPRGSSRSSKRMKSEWCL